MGRGNCCVFGKYEGLYYIDNDDIQVFYRPDGTGNCLETRILRELDYSQLTSGGWEYDDIMSAYELEDILECFIADFTDMFPCFHRPSREQWYSRSQKIILESKLFCLCTEDNESSVAVELIQKEAPWGQNYSGLQACHYQQYLDGMKTCLLNRLPSIGTYLSAWTVGTVSREELIA